MRLADHLLAKTDTQEGFVLGTSDDPIIPIGPPGGEGSCQYGPLGQGCFVRELKLSELMSAYGIPFEKRFEVAPGYDKNQLVRAEYPTRDYMWQSNGQVYKWAYLASLSIDRRIAYIPVNDFQSFVLGGCPGEPYSTFCKWADNTSCWTYLGNPSFRVTNAGAGPYCTATWMTWDAFWAWSPGIPLQTGPLPAEYGGPKTPSSSTPSSGSAEQIAGTPSTIPPSKPFSNLGLPSWAVLPLGIGAALFLVFLLSAMFGSSSSSSPSAYPAPPPGVTVVRRVYYS